MEQIKSRRDGREGVRKARCFKVFCAIFLRRDHRDAGTQGMPQESFCVEVQDEQRVEGRSYPTHRIFRREEAMWRAQIIHPYPLYAASSSATHVFTKVTRRDKNSQKEAVPSVKRLRQLPDQQLEGDVVPSNGYWAVLNE